MRTRTCRGLRLALGLLALAVTVGRAWAIGPGPLHGCKSAVFPSEPCFGYVPTTWRPWPPACAPGACGTPLPPLGGPAAPAVPPMPPANGTSLAPPGLPAPEPVQVRPMVWTPPAGASAPVWVEAERPRSPYAPKAH